MTAMHSAFHADLPTAKNLPVNAVIWRWLWRITVAMILLAVTYVGLRGIFEGFDSSEFPEALAVKVEILPLIFPLHMITGGLAFLLIPAAIGLRGRRWHRLAGRVTAADILLAGLTAPFVAWAAPVTLVSAAGFTVQAIVWVGLLLAGVWNIRRGRKGAHQTCMLLMASVTSGAVFFRIYLALWSHFGSVHYFKTFYACDAWLAWGLPLLVTAVVLRRGATYRATAH
jgi:uncharacterized membrane protein YozB (DUF420 family)